MAKLTEAALGKAEPQGKAYRLMDTDGLYAEVRPTGSISFRMRYWYHGRDTIITLGKWPYMRLREARERRDEIRSQLAHGLDPRAVAEYERTADERRDPTFEELARQWVAGKIAETQSEKQKKLLVNRLELHILPRIGRFTLDEIDAPLLLRTVAEPIQERGTIETAHRVISMIGQVFRWAIVRGHATRDPSRDLQGALRRTPTRHFGSITDRASFGVLLRNIADYRGSVIVREAMTLQYLTFVRPGELRHAEWTEIDLTTATWKIPAAKMKMKTSDHIVPLSRQSLDVLERMRPISGRGRYIFPSIRALTGSRPLSDMAMLAALRTMGYEPGQMTAHGFRHSASTFLNESGLWSPDAIEKQLAHEGADAIRAVYNYAKYLDERRRMMQWWADWCDEQRESVG